MASNNELPTSKDTTKDSGSYGKKQSKNKQPDISLPIYFTEYRFTRISSRYYFADVITKLTPNSTIVDVLSKNESIVHEILQPMNTMDLQAIDFGGTVGLILEDKVPLIKLGYNELIYQKKDDSLLAHEMNLVHFLNRSNYPSAQTELKYIGLWVHKIKNKREFLNYLCIRGYIHELQSELSIAKDYFAQAYEYLVNEFNSHEIDAISISFRNKYTNSIADKFNWNDLTEAQFLNHSENKSFDLKNELHIRSKPKGIIADLLGIKPPTRIPGRYSARLFISDLKASSIIRNVETGEQIAISTILPPMNTMQIQTLNFAGVIYIENDDQNKPQIKLAINELTSGIMDDSLLAHQMIFCNLMYHFKPQAALAELDRIRTITRGKISRRDEFCLMVAHARVHLRMRDLAKRIEGLILFEEAINFLHENFNDEEISQISAENARKYRSLDEFNWDSLLYDYDLVLTLTFYVNNAELLGLVSSGDDYSRLRDEAIEMATQYEMVRVLVYLRETKIRDLINEGRIDDAKQILDVLMELYENLHKTSPDTFDDRIFWDIFRSYIVLSLYTNNISKAKAINNIFASTTNLEKYPEARLYILRGQLAISNYQSDFENSLKMGMEIYDLVLQLGGYMRQSSNIFYIQPIFQMMIQANYVGKTEILEKSELIFSEIFEKNSDIADSPILVKIIKLYQSHIALNKTPSDINDLRSLLQEYNTIIQIENIPIYSLRILIVHYLHFALKFADFIPGFKDELVTQTSYFIEQLHGSANIILTAKLHVINMSLTNKVEELVEWVYRIMESTDLKTIKDIAFIVHKIKEEEDVSQITRHLQDLVADIVVNDQYPVSESTVPYTLYPLIEVHAPKHEEKKEEPYINKSSYEASAHNILLKVQRRSKSLD